MPTNLIPVLYGVAMGYAILTCIVRENGIVMIEVFGFGLPVLCWLLMEWLAPLVIAIFMGVQASASISRAMSGAPLVILFSVVSPTVHGKNVVIPTLIPWLAAFPSSLPHTLPILQERLLLWGSVFLGALVLGRISRLTHPSSGTR